MKKSTIGKVAYIAMIAAAVTMHVGCSNQTVTSIVSAPSTTENTTVPEPQISTDEPAVILSSSESESETSDSADDNEEYIQALLGDGETLVDEHGESGLYIRMSVKDKKANYYIELPQDSAENNCLMIAHIISSLLKAGASDGYSTISFFFHDYDGQQALMMSTYTNLSGTWQNLTPLMWYNDSYETAWEALSNS